MLLSSTILFGLCSSIAANAIDSKINIKSKLVDELSKIGVGMDQYCEFRVDDLKFNKTTITKDEAEAHVKNLIDALKPRRQNVDDLLTKLYEQKGSDTSIQNLITALVDFLNTVLVNELQLLQNFPLWVTGDRAKIMNNSECFAKNEAPKDYVERMNSDIALECGLGELELDSNKVCSILTKFQCALNPLSECQGYDPTCVEATKPKTETTIAAGLDELEAFYTETPEGLRNEEERYDMCLVVALGGITSDTNNVAHTVAGCILEDLSRKLNQDSTDLESDV